MKDVRYRLAENLYRLRNTSTLRHLPNEHKNSLYYFSQFAVNGKLNERRVRGKLSNRSASNRFGASDLEQYSYWAWRACSIASVQMVIYAKSNKHPKTMELIKKGLMLHGYDVNKDEGWTHESLTKLLKLYRIDARIVKVLTIEQILVVVAKGGYALCSMKGLVDSHMILVYGYKLNSDNGVNGIWVHDPNNFQKMGASQFIQLNDFKAIYNRYGIIVHG